MQPVRPRSSRIGRIEYLHMYSSLAAEPHRPITAEEKFEILSGAHLPVLALFRKQCSETACHISPMPSKAICEAHTGLINWANELG